MPKPLAGVYRGEWVGTRKEGLGVYTYPSGARYEGEWRDNAKNGRGIYYYPKGGVYEGEWANGKPEASACPGPRHGIGGANGGCACARRPLAGHRRKDALLRTGQGGPVAGWPAGGASRALAVRQRGAGRHRGGRGSQEDRGRRWILGPISLGGLAAFPSCPSPTMFLLPLHRWGGSVGPRCCRACCVTYPCWQPSSSQRSRCLGW